MSSVEPSTALTLTSSEEVSPQSIARRNIAPALALTVGGPALIWAGMSLGGTAKAKFALAGIGAVMMIAGLPQLSSEMKRLLK